MSSMVLFKNFESRGTSSSARTNEMLRAGAKHGMAFVGHNIFDRLVTVINEFISQVLPLIDHRNKTFEWIDATRPPCLSGTAGF